jgi:hypothetical protein
MDYSQYQLKLMFWRGRGFKPACCPSAHAIFNSTVVELEEITTILQNDQRVTDVVSVPWYNPKPRQLDVKLFDNECLPEVLNSYSSFDLAGAYFPHREACLLVFNDTTIYSGDFFDLLVADERVETVDFVHAIREGALLVSFSSWVNENVLADIREQYPYIHFHNPSPSWRARFDYREYNEFFVRNLLSSDERFTSVNLEFSFLALGLSRCKVKRENNVSTCDCTEPVPLNKISVYPNPVGLGTVTFRSNQKQDMSKTHSISEINIFNIRGQLVKSAKFEDQNFIWDRTDNNNNSVSSGIYFYKVGSGSDTQTGKFLIMK